MSTKKWLKKKLHEVRRAHAKHLLISKLKKEERSAGMPVKSLTGAEKAEIAEFWGRYGFRTSMRWHELLYGVTGLREPRFLPDDTFLLDILPRTRDEGMARAWSDKSYLDLHIHGVRTAECVLRNVDGHFLGGEHTVLSPEEAGEILSGITEPLVIKPSMDTNTGKGIRLIAPPFDLQEIVKEYKQNYVLQRPLHQHRDMGRLNQSSVNTIRVNSALVGNEVLILSAFVKVGQQGEFCDNHGKDRFFIGVRPDGTYQDFAINHDLKKFDSIPSGFAFAGQPVPSYAQACDAVRKAHMCLPHFVFAFWDICVSENGEPVIVEVNLRHPNPTIAQTAVNGPFLGEYTERIMDSIR